MATTKNNYGGVPLNPTLYPAQWGFIYWYDNVIPGGPAPALGYASGVWKWTAGAAGTLPDFSSPGFDDSTWTTASTPFATSQYNAANAPAVAIAATKTLIPTATPEDMGYRTYLTGIPLGSKLSIHGPSDDGVIIWWNGAQVWNDIGAGRGATYDNWSATVYPIAGTNVLAVLHRNGGGPGYFDAQVDYV